MTKKQRPLRSSYLRRRACGRASGQSPEHTVRGSRFGKTRCTRCAVGGKEGRAYACCLCVYGMLLRERGRGLWHAVKGKEGRAFGMLFLTFMPCYFGDYDMLLMMCCSRNDERI